MFAYQFPVDGLDDFRLCVVCFLTDESTATCTENIVDGSSRSSETNHHNEVSDNFFYFFSTWTFIS